MVKEVAKRCGIFFALLWILLLPVSAAETVDISDEEAVISEWQSILDLLPHEVAELLPDGLFATDAAGLGEGVKKAGSLSFLLRCVGECTGLVIGEALGILARICGVLVLAAVLRTVMGEGEEAAGRTLSVCTAAFILLTALGAGGQIEKISDFFHTVSSLSAALLPLMGTLYAMGGNVAAAVAHHGVMSGFLAVLENVCSAAVLPVGGICLLLALSDLLAGRPALRALSVLIKRTYTWGLSLLMLLLCGVLGIQSTLAKGADTLALRTVRFAAGSFLPVVGGSVSEALRTVAGSVEYLRSAVGMGGVILVFLAFLPTFLSVLLLRTAFLLSGAVASMLSCQREERLLAELASVWGYFLAVIACLFVMMVFSLTLFARTAAAIT
jgi:stage III sporulation protein AE